MSGTGSVGVVVPAGPLEALRILSNTDEIGPVLPTYGGFSNLSFETTLDSRRVVVKVATDESKRDDLRREAYIIARLRDVAVSSLATPEIVLHGDHGDWTVTVLAFIDGIGGYALLSDGADPVPLGTLLARNLAAVQTVRPDTRLGDREFALDLPTRWSTLQAVVEGIEMDEVLRNQVRRSLASPTIRRGEAFVHGDFGLHNVLWDVHQDPRRVRVAALLDWEFAGWGSPLTDLAWLWWTLTFRGVADAVWPSVVKQFGRTALRSVGFAPDDVVDLVRVQMVQLLSRTSKNSASRAAWLDRLANLAKFQRPTLE